MKRTWLGRGLCGFQTGGAVVAFRSRLCLVKGVTGRGQLPPQICFVSFLSELKFWLDTRWAQEIVPKV